MKTFIKFVVIFILALIANQNMLAAGPVPPQGDTLIITLDCSKDYYARPFVLSAKAGDLVKFVSTSGDFSILFTDAAQFFEDVRDPLRIHVNSNSKPESDTYTIKSTLKVGSEVDYMIICLMSGIIPDAPPKIIIVPRDEE